MSFPVFETVTIRASDNCLQADSLPAGVPSCHANVCTSCHCGGLSRRFTQGSNSPATNSSFRREPGSEAKRRGWNPN